LLPEFYPLHSGLTTGTCATAAAVAATIRLLEGRTPNEVPVLLPDGETIHVAVAYGADYASVIKDSGDDPDVTNGIEIRASVEPSDTFQIIGGKGVGTFTLPGFDFPPGEAAINKAPREMLRANIKENVRVTISVPDGEEIARRTFNPRLGIEGGISIIGVSGIVKPFSEQAFIHSIRKCMEVAKASGTDRVVINSGFKSERYLQALYPDLPSQAVVQYGNYIGETLKIANELNIKNVTLGVMLGKAVKLAQGHLDTHNRKTVMDKGFIAEMLDEADCHINIDDITLARELWERLPAEKLSHFSRVVIAHCYAHCAPLLEHGKLTILLIDDNGTIYEIQGYLHRL
jgi:cobalt-precorrin-5B (C1)-methyltransferase